MHNDRRRQCEADRRDDGSGKRRYRTDPLGLLESGRAALSWHDSAFTFLTRTGKIGLVLAIVLFAALCPKAAMCGRLCGSLTAPLLRLVLPWTSANIAPMSKAITASVISGERSGKKVSA